MVCTFSPPGVSSALRKQFARALAQCRVGWRDTGLADRVVQRVIVERDPVTERREHPLRHVGGGRLGEGDAQDLLRRHAVEQQADHALHQHVGLARTGIGRHERRGGGIGRARLRVADGRRESVRGAFTIPPSQRRRQRTIP